MVLTDKLAEPFGDSLQEYLAYKEIFEKRGIKNIILVISNIQNPNNYLGKISDEKWIEALDTIPIVYPYAFEEIHSLIQDHNKLKSLCDCLLRNYRP